MGELHAIVANIMANNLHAAKSDSILVLTDESTSLLAKKFRNALSANGWRASYYEMEDRTKSGEEPPEEASAEMLKHDIVFCLTKHSLTHTAARKNANLHGIGVITMPGITEDMFVHGAINADYKRVEKETLAMTERLAQAEKLIIKTGKNQLAIPLHGREGVPSTGVFKGKSASGNLPSGEAYIAPVEGEAEGQIEINGSIAGIGLLERPIVLTIKKGRLVEATGEDGKKLLSLLGNGDGRLLCELGIGTNHAARVTGNILEDEKAYNTIHVAFGSNHTFGGSIKTNVHIDCVTIKPEMAWIFPGI
ncbi:MULTISPECIES: aminopeptidase [Peribacillus]|uniref:aminopeptidase n=1 Tax=Peribacillus TaxID=2675229 RepID=UPI001F4DAD2B|nr:MULTISPECIES: aminopeptidase [unclassified Peribacillus]MCK1984653.1 aminopeptidase [Peribacillus sp. Aquil_B1]MCK2009048.1 aminopeptidase [Peribacillus sp. Aquil_B8]